MCRSVSHTPDVNEKAYQLNNSPIILFGPESDIHSPAQMKKLRYLSYVVGCSRKSSVVRGSYLPCLNSMMTE